MALCVPLSARLQDGFSVVLACAPKVVALTRGPQLRFPCQALHVGMRAETQQETATPVCSCDVLSLPAAVFFNMGQYLGSLLLQWQRGANASQ